MRKAFAALILLAVMGAAGGGEAPPAAEDPALERRVTALADELRCLVCQNQSLADSNADLAVDLKNQIREKLRQGMSERQIADYMVERYGDFVLYRPPFKLATVLLWFGPLLFLVAGIATLFYRLARRRKEAAGRELTPAERARASALLAAAENPKR